MKTKDQAIAHARASANRTGRTMWVYDIGAGWTHGSQMDSPPENAVRVRPTRVRVAELEPGDLFIWEVQPDYLHRAAESDQHEHFATRDPDGGWRFYEPRPQNWNLECVVQRVRIEIVEEK